MKRYVKAFGRLLARIGLVVVPVWAMLLGYAVWSDPASVRTWIKLLCAVGIWFWLYEDVCARPAEQTESDETDRSPQSAKTDSAA